MPFAVQEIRKLGETGHEVYAADTFATAPGNHSRHVSKALVTPAPVVDADAYVEAISGLVREYAIERLLPTFEEVFYLARRHERFANIVDPFFAEFDTLARLHDKVAFTQLCAELGIAVAPWLVASSRSELAAATREFAEGFFARPAFSRGGLDLYTNRGPLAGALSLVDCSPTSENRWLVQRYLRGEDRCSYAIAQHGRLAAHVCYVHPHTIDHAGGIVFESIEDAEMTEVGRRIVEATGYHGQLALDFIRTEDGLIAIECNPRATAGVAMMSAVEFAAAIDDRSARTPILAPSGRRRKISAAILRKIVREPRQLLAGLRALVHGGEDLYGCLDDPMPALFQVLSYVHVLRYRAKRDEPPKRSKLTAAYLHDLQWNGQPFA
jgi:glutathione synthase/RimK-type ligase-like ATP-grasp enzyme